MFAIVRTGGKQYRVGVGDQITVERIVGDVGAEIELADVLAIGGDETPVIGTPIVPDAARYARESCSSRAVPKSSCSKRKSARIIDASAAIARN